MTAPLPDAHLCNANNDEEDWFGKSIPQQLLLPVKAINERRDGTHFWMRVPLTEVGTRPAAFLPGTIDCLLVPPPRPEKLKTTTPITRHRYSDIIHDDVIGSQDMPTQEYSSGFSFLRSVLDILAYHCECRGTNLKTASMHTGECQATCFEPLSYHETFSCCALHIWH
jgi:hypothetical protein